MTDIKVGGAPNFQEGVGGDAPLRRSKPSSGIKASTFAGAVKEKLSGIKQRISEKWTSFKQNIQEKSLARAESKKNFGAKKMEDMPKKGLFANLFKGGTNEEALTEHKRFANEFLKYADLKDLKGFHTDKGIKKLLEGDREVGDKVRNLPEKDRLEIAKHVKSGIRQAIKDKKEILNRFAEREKGIVKSNSPSNVQDDSDDAIDEKVDIR